MYIIAAGLLLAPLETRLSDIQQIESTRETSTLIFVRHGESALNVIDANGVKYTSGRSLTIPLTEIGKKQADDLGAKLIGKLSPDQRYVILSSTALRAQETADRIFEQLKSHYSVERGGSYDNLCEVGKGIWEGKPRDEKYDEQIKKWEVLSAKEKYYTPKLNTGESCHDVVAKAILDLQNIVESYPDKIVIIVSHFETMNSLAIHWSGQLDQLPEEPSTPLPKLQLSNCDIMKVDVPHANSVESAQVQMHIKAEV
jgi:broad specificity phosphatase PhoE